jgi:uncharacterized protein (UPF0548 family)
MNVVHRAVEQMSTDEVARLADAELTYSPVGATRTSTYPEGFHRLEHTIELGTGDDAFEVARDRLMTWRMHLDAGLRVTASRPRVTEGTVVRCGLGPLQIPCRVVWVHEEPDSCGFAYGTLPGHPESGEEAFLLVRNEGRVRLVISAYSRPGRLSTRLAGPLGRIFQRVMTRRYAAALKAAVGD